MLWYWCYLILLPSSSRGNAEMIKFFKQLCSSHTQGHPICHHCLLTCKASWGTLLPTWAHRSLGQAEQRESITEMPLPTEEWERWRNQCEPKAHCGFLVPLLTLVAAVACTTFHWDPKDSPHASPGMGQLWHSLATRPVSLYHCFIAVCQQETKEMGTLRTLCSEAGILTST